MTSKNSGGAIARPAPYGQACANCARAKNRCLYQANRQDCERCHRLNKECVVSVSARRLTATNGPDRNMGLDEKIDQLVTLLRSQAAEKVNTPITIERSMDINTPTSSTDLPVASTSNATPYSAESEQPGFDVRWPPMPTNRADPSMSPYEPSTEQAEECLAYFQTHMLSIVPFVYLSPGITARQLHESYPFLWLNIMAVTIKHIPDQNSDLTEHIKSIVAQKMIMDNEMNLDLLLGLLVFICWSHFHYIGRTYCNVMISLASSLIIDMRHHKGQPLSEVQANSRRINDEWGSPQVVTTMAEKRAMLAYFYIISKISHAKKKVHTPDWTPYLDECLQVVMRYPEWIGDEQLAFQLKVQLLVEQVDRATWRNYDNRPPTSFLEILQMQLAKLKTELPQCLDQNVHISRQILDTEIAIQDAMINVPRASFLYNPNHQHYQLLERQFLAIKQGFDLFFSALSPEQYPGLTSLCWYPMAQYLVFLYRLLYGNLDGFKASWDQATARQRVDLFGLCDRLAELSAKVGADGRGVSGCSSSSTSEKARDDMFIIFSRTVRSMSNAWLVEVQLQQQHEQASDLQAGSWTRHQGLQSVQASHLPMESSPYPNVGAFPGSTASRGTGATTSQSFGRSLENAWLDGIFDVSW